MEYYLLLDSKYVQDNLNMRGKNVLGSTVQEGSVTLQQPGKNLAVAMQVASWCKGGYIIWITVIRLLLLPVAFSVWQFLCFLYTYWLGLLPINYVHWNRNSAIAKQLLIPVFLLFWEHNYIITMSLTRCVFNEFRLWYFVSIHEVGKIDDAKPLWGGSLDRSRKGRMWY